MAQPFIGIGYGPRRSQNQSGGQNDGQRDEKEGLNNPNSTSK
jgi:hypothetical protein